MRKAEFDEKMKLREEILRSQPKKSTKKSVQKKSVKKPVQNKKTKPKRPSGQRVDISGDDLIPIIALMKNKLFGARFFKKGQVYCDIDENGFLLP